MLLKELLWYCLFPSLSLAFRQSPQGHSWQPFQSLPLSLPVVKRLQTIFSAARYCVCRLARLAFPGIFSYCSVAPRFPALLWSRHNDSKTFLWFMSALVPASPPRFFPQLWTLLCLVFSLAQWMNREHFTTQSVPHSPLIHSSLWLPQSQPLPSWMLWMCQMLFSKLPVCQLHKLVDSSRNGKYRSFDVF